MDLERNAVVEAGAAIVTVSLFVAGILWIGHTFNQDGLNEAGSLALVGGIILFVLVMSAVGIGLAYYTNRSEN